MRKRIRIDELTNNSAIYLLSRKELDPKERVITLAVTRLGDKVRLVNRDYGFDETVDQNRLDEDYQSTVPIYFHRPHEAAEQYRLDQVGTPWETTTP